MTKFHKYEKYGSAPIVFTDDKTREEWNEMSPDLRSWIKNNLMEACEKTSLQHSIEL